MILGYLGVQKPTKKHQESHKNRSLEIDAKNHRKIRDFGFKMGAQIDPKIDAKIDAKNRLIFDPL